MSAFPGWPTYREPRASLHFKVGDCVSWSAKSGGALRTYTGEITHVIPPDTDLRAALSQAEMRQLWGTGMSRSRESYVVLVGKKKYWPREESLVLVTSVAGSRE